MRRLLLSALIVCALTPLAAVQGPPRSGRGPVTPAGLVLVHDDARLPPVPVVSLLFAAGGASQSDGVRDVRRVTLRGVLLDAANGAAVRRARIEIFPGGPAGAGVMPAIPGLAVDAVLSDDQGRFTAEVPSGAAVTVRVTKAGYAATTRPVSAGEFRDLEPLLIALDRGAVIAGRAVDTAGEPAGAAAILVRRVAERTEPQMFLTPLTPDERGEFRLGGLAAGRYLVDGTAASIGGLRSAPVEVEVQAGEEVPVVLVFERVPAAERSAGWRFDANTGTIDALPPPAPAPSGGRTIRGTVSTIAGTPLGAASVSAIGGSVRRSATTDGLGRFAIDGLTPGSYTVDAFKPGYVRTEHGQRALDLPGIKVVVEAGIDVENVAIALPNAAVVSGIVFDEFGEPVQDAGVQVMRVVRPAAGLPLVRAQGVQDAGVQVMRVIRSTAGLTLVGEQGPSFVRTDDRGHFRAGNLMPGEYVVSASVAAHVVIDGVRRAYRTAFWPAAGDLGTAAPVQAREGEETGGLALTLRPVPVARLTGMMLTSAGGPASGSVRLMAARGSESSLATRTIQPDAKGRFSFDDVTAGEYVIQASASSGPRGPESGRRTVTVDVSANPDPVTIRTSPGSSVRGRIVLEGGRPGELMWGYSATAAADGLPGAPASVSNLGSPTAGGEPFTMSPLAGPTRLRFRSDDENWYLKAVFINGFDAADAVFDFGFDGHDYTDAEVVFSRLGGTISGRVTDERAAPVRDYAVYVFSSDRDRWIPGSRWVRLARAGADGTFRIRSLPPGTYWAVAVDRLDLLPQDPDLADPAALDTLLPQAASVIVGEAETRDVTLRLLRR